MSAAGLGALLALVGLAGVDRGAAAVLRVVPSFWVGGGNSGALLVDATLWLAFVLFGGLVALFAVSLFFRRV